jgi:hypothetical protein
MKQFNRSTPRPHANSVAGNLVVLSTSLGASAAAGLVGAIAIPTIPEVAVGAAVVGLVGGYWATKLDKQDSVEDSDEVD